MKDRIIESAVEVLVGSGWVVAVENLLLVQGADVVEGVGGSFGGWRFCFIARERILLVREYRFLQVNVVGEAGGAKRKASVGVAVL